MKSRIPVRLAAIAAIAVVATMPTACSSSKSGSATLEFATEQAADSPTLAALKAVTADFEKTHPKIKINIKTGSDDYEEQMKVRLAAHNPPDIWETHGWSLLRYSRFLAPLNNEPWAKNFNPALAPAMKNANGQFFALPIDTDAAGLVVNRTVLKAAGVDPDTITDWQSFSAAANKVKAKGRVALTLSGGTSGAAGQIVDWLAPGTFTDAELAQFKAGNFQSASYQKLLGVMHQMVADGWINPDYSSAKRDDMARSFAQDKAAFALQGNDLTSAAWKYNPNADLGFIPIPAVSGGPSYMIGGEHTAFGIGRAGKHVADAKAYLDFLAQPKNISVLAKAAGNLPGLTNATPDLGKLSTSFNKYVIPGKIPLKPYFDRVYLPNGMWDTLVSTSDAVITGQSAPAGATDKVKGDFTTLYKQQAGQ